MGGALAALGTIIGSSAINPALAQSSLSSLRQVSVIGTNKKASLLKRSIVQAGLIRKYFYTMKLIIRRFSKENIHSKYLKRSLASYRSIPPFLYFYQQQLYTPIKKYSLIESTTLN